MNFTLSEVNQAIAAAVKAAIPSVTVYDNPNQQNTVLPAAFLTYRGEQELKDQIGNRWMQKLSFDLCYLVDYNLPDLGDQYRAAAESLDGTLDSVLYAGNKPLRVENRSWFVELDALHYQFDIPVRLMKPYTPTPMKSMSLEEKIK